MVFDWVRESPFSYSNLGWKKWKSGKVTWFSRQPPVPRRWWVKIRGRANGRRKEEYWGAVTEKVLSDMPAKLSSWHWSAVGSGRASGLLFWLVKDGSFSPTSLFSLWGEVSPHSGSQAVASGTTSCLCHQLSPALSLLPHWLNTWRTSEWQAPFCPPTSPPKRGPQRSHRYSSPRPPPASLSVFWVIHM